MLKHKDMNNQHCNVVLSKEIQDRKDYEVITKEIWQEFTSKFPKHIEIKRFAYKDESNYKKLEVHLKTISFIFINNQILTKIDKEEYD